MKTAIFFSLFYASLAEYAAHRWIMHIPAFGRGSWWRNHAIVHHKEGRTDVNIGLSPLTVTLAATPLFLLCIWLGWAYAAYLLAAAIIYAAAWSALHAAIHGIECLWMRRLPLFWLWERHHRRHHEQPYLNFGTIFIWTDALFRTHAK